jgi:hypothetical protein
MKLWGADSAAEKIMISKMVKRNEKTGFKVL